MTERTVDSTVLFLYWERNAGKAVDVSSFRKMEYSQQTEICAISYRCVMGFSQLTEIFKIYRKPRTDIMESEEKIHIR